MTPLGRIMIVDDEEFDHLIYDRIITRSGMVEEVVGLFDPAQALDYLKDDRNPNVHLILLDVNMPGMSGMDFLDEARGLLEETATPVIVMLTTPLPTDLKQRAAGHDAIVDYFMKPFRDDHLERARDVIAQRLTQSDTPDAA